MCSFLYYIENVVYFNFEKYVYIIYEIIKKNLE